MNDRKIERVYKQFIEEAKTAIHQKNRLEARAILGKLIEKNYRLDYVYYLRALASEIQEEALSYLEKSLQVNPNAEKSRHMLERIRERINAGGPEVAGLDPEKPNPVTSTPPKRYYPFFMRDYYGQGHFKPNLMNRMRDTLARKEPLEHLLFTGPEEMGKVTLARCVANDIGVSLRHARGDMLELPGDLGAILNGLQTGGILLIEDLEKISHSSSTLLETALSDFALEFTIGKLHNAREIRLKLPPFTVIGTTSKPTQVQKRLLRWFTVQNFRPYSINELKQIVLSFGNKYGFQISADSAELIAQNANGNPGEAAVIVRRLGNAVTNFQATLEKMADLGYRVSSDGPLPFDQLIDDMDGAEFEDFIAQLYFNQGYRVELTGKSGDHGIDLVIQKDLKPIAIQCKRWNSPVGEPVVRDFYGALMHSAYSEGIIITSSTFTQEAKLFSADKPIQLLDFDLLHQMYLNQGERK